jgi:NADH:ubiquinone oxidoreductase subunit 6 (subunit J)
LLLSIFRSTVTISDYVSILQGSLQEILNKAESSDAFLFLKFNEEKINKVSLYIQLAVFIIILPSIFIYIVKSKEWFQRFLNKVFFGILIGILIAGMVLGFSGITHKESFQSAIYQIESDHQVFEGISELLIK